MKRIIRLTENDLARIVRRVIKENKSDDVLECVATAADLNLLDLIKLAPCAKLQKDPTQENIESCLEAAQSIINKKTQGMSFIEKAQYVAKLGLNCAACLE